MKAFVYTLLLSAILVGCIILLRSIEVGRGTPSEPGQLPLVVSSRAVPSPEFDLEGMEAASAADLYTMGLELLDLWHVREAVGILEEAVRRDSSSLAAYVKLIECYSYPLIWREDDARTCWERARSVAGSQDSLDALLLDAVGEMYLEADYEAAIEKTKRIVEASSDNHDAGYYLAWALLQMGRLEEAERRLETLLSKDESNGRVRELLIRCAAARGDIELAESLAKDLAALYSEHPYPYVLLSRAEILRGKIEEAEEFCNNALLLDRRHLPAILCRGDLYAIHGEREAARATFEKLLLFDDPILLSVGCESIAYLDFLWGDFDEGMEMMDEAIRHAMLIGSVRRGLAYGLRLVDYLCQLGRGDAARVVLERWFGGFGRIPVRLGSVRLDIFNGDLESVWPVLDTIESDREYRSWMRLLGLEWSELVALAHIKDRQYSKALELLARSEGGRAGGKRHAYLRGYAAFESGDAERAAAAFEEVFARPGSFEFPYHHDPVLHVQSLFYLGEIGIARGDPQEAIHHYEAFIDFWGEADWELQAISRAREKLEALSASSSGD